MLLNYFKLATRLLIRNPIFTFLNVFGLSTGFAVFYILCQHSSYELKSDQFHKDSGRIFRLYFDLYHNTGADWSHFVSGALPPVFTSIIKEKYTQIESATRIIHQANFDQVRWAGPQTDTAGWSELNPNTVFSFIGNDGRKYCFTETNAVYADPNLFEFFSIQLLAGSAKGILANPDAVVLSSATALKYFGKEDPIGKTLTLGESESFTVAGVFEDLPKNTHLNFELVLSTERIKYATENVDPFMRSAQTYVKIARGASVTDLQRKLNEEHKIHWDLTSSFPGSTLTFFLQPLKDVSFRVFDNDVFRPKSKYIAEAFQVIAFIVLVMALINYVNLKLSLNAGRMKELAARKTAGASRIDFITQFLVESLIINILALLMAFTLVQLMASALETLFHFYLPRGKEVSMSTTILFIVTMTLGILIAGLIPAFFVWNMTTKKMLGYKKSTSRTLFVQTSTVVQFVSAIALIIWLFSVSNQVDFVTEDSWGLNRKGVIVIELPTAVFSNASIPSNVQYFKNELLSTPGVEDVALSTTVAGDLVDNPVGFNRVDTPELWVVSKSDGGVDERFIPFYGLKLVAGRNFLPDNPADKRSVIISRQTAKSAGLDPEAAIGKMVEVGKHPWRPFSTQAEIIGVIEEHRYNPLYVESGINTSNKGTILTYGNFLFPKNEPLRMSVRVRGKRIGETIEKIKKEYQRIFPQQIFNWYTLDGHMNTHYKSENIVRNQILLFTCIAIGIGCLGLLGMISHKVLQKTKEIGIRKVFGAELHHIAEILLDTTIRQVVIATIIGIPVSFFLTEQYLTRFSERIILQWWHFVFPIGILLVILFSSITAVVWKATRTSPVDSLRYE